IDYWRRKQAAKKRPVVPLRDDCAAAPESVSSEAEHDKTFLSTWRKEIMAHAERALIRLDERKGRCYHAILRFKARYPKKSSTDLAQHFSTEMSQPLNAIAFRQLLRRAREKLADLLVAEIARSRSTSDPQVIEAEVIDLSMHSFCRHSLA